MSSEEFRAKDDLNEQPQSDPQEAPASEAPDQTGEVEEQAARAQAGREQAAEPGPEEEISLDVLLEQAEARAEEYLDSLQRERASFQNYKKRVEAERLAQAERMRGEILIKLLPVLDDFYRALEAVPAEERDSWYEGVVLIQRKLERFLEEQGVTEIPALGQRFDPNYHEAVGVEENTDAEPDTIVEVVQRGYQQRDRVLRPALVRVAR